MLFPFRPFCKICKVKKQLCRACLKLMHVSEFKAVLLMLSLNVLDLKHSQKQQWYIL